MTAKRAPPTGAPFRPGGNRGAGRRPVRPPPGAAAAPVSASAAIRHAHRSPASAALQRRDPVRGKSRRDEHTRDAGGSASVATEAGSESSGSSRHGDDLVESDLRGVEPPIVVPEGDDPGRVPAVAASPAAATVPARERLEPVRMDGRGSGHIERGRTVRRAAGRAVSGSRAAGQDAVPADPALNRLDEVATRVDVDYGDQEEAVRVSTDPSVAVRRPAAPTRSAVPAGDGIDRVPPHLAQDRRTGHFDCDGRARVPASAARGRRDTTAPGTTRSAGDVGDRVPRDGRIWGGRDDDPRSGASVPAATGGPAEVRLTIAAPSPA